MNPHGLHHDNHYTTARDIAKILEYAWKNETLRKIMSTQTYTVPATNKNPKRVLYHTLAMLNQSDDKGYYRSYVLGGKTGFEEPAGRCVATVASVNNSPYLCVTLNAPWKDTKTNGYLKTNYAFTDSGKIYDWVASSLKVVSVAKTSDPVHEIRVKASFKRKHVLLYPKEDFFVVIPKESESNVVKTNFIETPDSVFAPLKESASVGKVQFVYNGNIIGTVEMVVKEDVSRSYLLYGFEIIKGAFSSPWLQLALVLFLLCLLFYIYMTIQVNKKRKAQKQLAQRRNSSYPSRTNVRSVNPNNRRRKK